MQRFFKYFVLAAVFLLGHTTVFSAEMATDHPEDRVKLAALRVALIDAINKGDVDGIVSRLHPNVVVTWQNSEVCRGRDGVKKFYQAMAAQPKKTFQGYKVPPTPDELTILYSDATTGVVYGYNIGHFYLAGKEIEMPNRWTATVVKENGEWLLASYHVSMNVVDNPLLNGVKKTASVGFVVALVIGALVGWLLGRKRKRGV